MRFKISSHYVRSHFGSSVEGALHVGSSRPRGIFRELSRLARDRMKAMRAMKAMKAGKTKKAAPARRKTMRQRAARKTGDLATPLTWSFRAAARARQRRVRSAAACPAPAAKAFPWNDACRMALLPVPPSTRALRHVWNVVHADVWPEPPASEREEARRTCAVCGSPTSRTCICGASFAHTTREKELGLFTAFVRDKGNPCLRADDPQDQAEFAQLFSELSNAHGGAACPPVALLRVLFVGAVTGNPQSTAALGPAAFRGPKAFSKALRQRLARGLPVFRAGQCPGGSLRQVGAELAGFSRGVAPALAKTLKACAPRSPAASREAAIADVARQVAFCAASARAARPARSKTARAAKPTARLARGKTARAAKSAARLARGKAARAAAKKARRASATTMVMGGTYRRKRFLELLFLAAACGCAGWRVGRRETDAVGGVWPVAAGTAAGLRRIWPGLRSPRLLREGLRALQRALRPGDVDLPSISALLCFGGKQRKKIIQWRE